MTIEKMAAWLKSEGVVTMNDPTAEQLLIKYLVDVPEAQQLDKYDVVFCYLYDMDQQQYSQRFYESFTSDSLAWYRSEDGRVYYVIGVSRQALEQGQEYTARNFYHELAHIISGLDHGPEFNQCLDRMLAEYNASTGKHLVNDYANA